MLPVRQGTAPALTLLLALTGCSREPPRRPDVLLITIDTLRADHVGCYGSDLGATPALDALAAEGAVFLNHYSVAAHTAPVHATLMTGLQPREHGLHTNGQSLPEDVTTLAERFSAAGYRTGAFIGSAVLRSEFRFDAGFEVFDEDFSAPMHRAGQGRRASSDEFERTAGDVVARALEFLARGDTRPVFLWVHVYDPHQPYQTPPRWKQVFSPPDFDDRHPAGLGPNPDSDSDFIPRMVSLRLAAYANEVRYTDEQLGELLQRWRARPRPGIVALTADHGEGLFEHGYRGHGLLLYEEQLRVPLILVAPGRIAAGTRTSSVTSAVDFAATLLDLANLRPPPGLGGTSLIARPESAPGAGLALAERRQHSSEELVRNQAVHDLLRQRGHDPRQPLPEELALVDGTWKAIWTEGGEPELYDLATDPDELVDLARAEPERAAAMAETLRAWWEAAGRGREALREAGSTADAEVERMLRALGY